jgi:4-diphosphocytidyl-2-C-methyl-D-erythritol kinase
MSQIEFHVICNAKLNLCLLVYAPRSDGYHPLTSVFQTISLSDSLSIQLHSKSDGFELTCNDPNVPTDENNFLSRIFLDHQDKIPFGIRIHLEKRIPVGGGLGGGSSNAAGFMAFLNRHADWKLSEAELRALCSKYGSDIPYFCVGGTALVEGIGDKIQPLHPGPFRHFVIVNPRFPVSTPAVYKQFDKMNLGSLPSSEIAPWILEEQVGFNSLKQPAYALFPKLQEIENLILQSGLSDVFMSGSGATLFSPFRNIEDASYWETKLSHLLPGCLVKHVETTERGLDY